MDINKLIYIKHYGIYEDENLLNNELIASELCSSHRINIILTAEFLPSYFDENQASMIQPDVRCTPSLY